MYACIFQISKEKKCNKSWHVVSLFCSPSYNYEGYQTITSWGQILPVSSLRSPEHVKTFLISFHIVEASFCRHSPGHCIPSCVWASTRPTGGPESFHPDDPQPRLPAATGTHTATSCKNRKNKMCQIQVRPVSWVKPARMDKGHKQNTTLNNSCRLIHPHMMVAVTESQMLVYVSNEALQKLSEGKLANLPAVGSVKPTTVLRAVSVKVWEVISADICFSLPPTWTNLTIRETVDMPVAANR